MASYTLKLSSVCNSGTGQHGTIAVTGDVTASFSLNAEELRDVLNRVAPLSQREKALYVLALHANINGQTLGQLRTELLSVNGVQLVI